METVAELRTVVAWARANPHVIRYSFRPVEYLNRQFRGVSRYP
jgi:hypothetical protein